MADFPDQPAYSFEPGPPREASTFLRNKALRPSFSWQDIEPEEHAVAFTVAKATDLNVLQAIREEVLSALDEGLPFTEFQKRLKPRLEERGWWGFGGARDLTTGQERPAVLGTPRRLKTIYRANLRSARAAGQWERIQRTKRALPYLTYRLGPSERHRPTHETKDGLTLPIDDPFWDSWMPPNGWGCKCWVRQVGRAEAEELGIEESPAIPMREVENKRTGEIKQVPVGIDPGWERNPGALRLAAAEQHLARTLVSSDPAVHAAAGRDVATSWRVRRIVEEGALGTAPIGVLPEALADHLGAKSRTVLISADTAAKQLANHSDLKPEDYGAVADLIAFGEVRQGDDPHSLMFLEKKREFPSALVLKATKDGSEVFIKTFYANMSRRFYERRVASKPVIRD